MHQRSVVFDGQWDEPGAHLNVVLDELLHRFLTGFLYRVANCPTFPLESVSVNTCTDQSANFCLIAQCEVTVNSLQPCLLSTAQRRVTATGLLLQF